jgi:macrodomain Ter protein organizer (MatP/YcbG family)
MDLPTSRILFFTTDDSVELDPKDGAVLIYHEGPLPEKMTLANAWSYKYKNQKFIVPNEIKRKILTVVDKNRAEVLSHLQKEVTKLQKLFGPRDLYAEESRRVKLMQAIAIQNGENYDAEFVSAVSASCGCNSAQEFAEFIIAREQQCVRLIMDCEILYRKWQYLLNNCYDSNEIIKYSEELDKEIEQIRTKIQPV